METCLIQPREGEIIRVKSRVDFGHVNTMLCEFREVQSGG